MFSPLLRRSLSLALILGLTPCLFLAQKPSQDQDIETIKIDTNLVTVPVVATDANGVYVADLRQDEFVLAEDGVAQQIAFFGKVSMPFHVVLMLDTSSSTVDVLQKIQQAAFTFVQQLQPGDRVKVISFDDRVRDLNEFTNDREVLRQAINGTRSGQGTKVYDAVETALNTIRRIQGRKAIVIFTDGMDWHSDNATYESNVRWLDEEGVIVYPIRYETRATTERLAREQSGEQLPTIDVIRKPPTGRTEPTFPGGDQEIPTSSTQNTTGPFGLPSASEIMRRRREAERNRYPVPDSNKPVPGPPDPVPEKGVPRLPGEKRPGSPEPIPGSTSRPNGPDDSISRMLDLAYDTADHYLAALAEKSGGRLVRADTIGSLPDAFGQIAAELRTQYLLGYYPVNKERDERYRKIKVTTVRKHVVIRARPGYIASAAR